LFGDNEAAPDVSPRFVGHFRDSFVISAPLLMGGEPPQRSCDTTDSHDVGMRPMLEADAGDRIEPITDGPNYCDALRIDI